MHIDVPYIDPIPEGVTAKIFKQTNVCRVEPQPYDPKTFQLETETITHADGTTETRPADVHNVIRWRHVLDEDGKQVMGEDGEPKIESNAKFVRWSDGSLTLHIGEEVLRVTETDKIDMYDCFVPGDVVRARILSMGDTRSYYLTTAANELGVVRAKSPFTGELMVAASWEEMECPSTGQRCKRKVAKVE